MLRLSPQGFKANPELELANAFSVIQQAMLRQQGAESSSLVAKYPARPFRRHLPRIEDQATINGYVLKSFGVL
jgi:hypothetical protein